jgi:hypothetical protein
MKAEELRIGNWITYAGQEIELTRQKFKLSVFTLGLDELHEPIPLTKEWLIRFGFEYNYSFDLYSKSGFDIQLLENGIEFYIGEYGSYFTWIECVHQLQNLYFALTGNELTIK